MTMRNLPIDSTQIVLVSSGKVMAKPEYALLSDGSRKRVPGAQAKDPATGMPLWVLDCFVDDDEDEGRADVVGVTVSCYERPEVKKFRPVEFVGLTATGYVRDGRVAFSFRASGLALSQVKAA
jgi:hypothetical protein